MHTFDIIVAGTGPAGLASASAFARAGLRVALVGPAARSGQLEDTRTAALFQGSLSLLRNIGAWETLEAATAPLTGIRIIDDGDNLLRAPEVTFEAHELGLSSFGANVPQMALSQSLAQAVTELENIEWIDARVTGIAGGAVATVSLSSGADVGAALVAAADGRNSACRQAAGIATETWDYPQIAIAAQFSHSRDHRGISSEFHRPSGPCTVVPLPGRRSSLVWVERPAIAQRLMTLDETAFAAALEARLHGVLGSVSSLGARRMFPLSCLKAAVLGANRVALVGEAGHALPPIGAQGLNLGFRDVAELAELVAVAHRAGQDIGGDTLLAQYARARQRDVSVRTTAVDWLNRSLLADMLPSDLARGAGLHLIGGIAALKQQVMRAGFEPSGTLPPLMRAAS
jgi:2-octaprenyl-6-methoxyphenol hydroxylase